MTSESAGGGAMAWPRAVFEAPVLRGIDAHGRAELASSGRLFGARAGQVIYEEGDASDSFFVVAQGSVRLSAVRRGDDRPSELRVARRGDTFGEEAAQPGGARRAQAAVAEAAELVEVPMAVFRRVAGRSGADAVAEREQRALRRTATRDLLRTLAFSRELSDDDLDLLLDAVQERALRRGERLFAVGDVADACFLVVDGVLQLQTEHDGRLQVRAYLARGDLFGDEELIAGERRAVGAVALGDARCLRVPGALMRSLVDRNPGLLGRMRRIAADRQALQERVVGAAAARTTQHVFQDVYRMQMARSLLVIDQDTCVRCGHCAWACADLYGVSRIVRRGDKMLADLTADADSNGAPKSLLLPNSCQHCNNPVCMIDCPTGAIGRDPEGEVFIRADICTGCGACAKACPWDNIQMAPREASAGVVAVARAGSLGTSELVAVKCDLCRDYEAPACVQACPTESILRLEPMQDLSEVGGLFGSRAEPAAPEPKQRALALAPAVALAVAVALGAIGWRLQTLGVWVPGRGPGLVAGWLSGFGSLALAAYVLPKRLTKLWMKRRVRVSAPRRLAESATPRKVDESSRQKPRSKLRLFVILHIALGLVVAAAAVSHSGTRLNATPAGALALSFWAVVLLGALGAFVYRALPARLARLERRGTLPEDLAAESELLVDRLHRETSGKDDLVKRIVDKLLVPYARAFGGPLLLIASGLGLREEEARLRARVERVLEGRGGNRLAGLDDLVRTVVEIRALPARRALTFLLRAWLPAHALLAALFVVLLMVHVYSVIRW